MKRVFALLVLVGMLCSLAGCSMLSLDESDILAPPQAYGQQAQIEALIKQQSPSFTPVRPQNGDNRSAVSFHDFDGDGDDDAAALYKTKSGELHILFARRDGGSFVTEDDAALACSGIDRIDFCDLNGDQKPEVLLGSFTATGLCSLSIYSVGDGVESVEIPSSYNAYILGDFDADGRGDTLMLTLYSSVSLALARLMSFNDDLSLIEKASCELDSAVTEFAQSIYGQIGTDVWGGVIDGKNASGEYTTQLITYNRETNTLLNPLFIYSGYRDTRRTVEVLSQDIDGDGIIEVPLCALLPYSSLENETTVCYGANWSCYDLTTITPASKQLDILSPASDYLFHVAPAREGAITARYDTVDRVMTVYLWEYNGGSPAATTKLLTIHTYSRTDYDEQTVLEAQLDSTNTEVFTYVIEDESGLFSFTDDEVKKSFALIK